MIVWKQKSYNQIVVHIWSFGTMASLVAAGYGSSTDDELDSESEGRQETTKTKSDSSDSSTSSNSDSDDVDENEQSE